MENIGRQTNPAAEADYHMQILVDLDDMDCLPASAGDFDPSESPLRWLEPLAARDSMLLETADQSPSAIRPTGSVLGGAPTPDDDAMAAWLSAAAAGNGDAFAQFYDATIVKVRTQARKRLRPCDVEDLIADAYFEAWRNASRFDLRRGTALNWILCIVRSRSLDRRRRNQTHPSVGGLDALHHPEQMDPGLGPVDLLQQAQLGREVRVAIDGLSPTERWLVGLAYIRDLTHSEIAASTGLPLGTVKSHLRRVLRKVGTAMAPVVIAQPPGTASTNLSTARGP